MIRHDTRSRAQMLTEHMVDAEFQRKSIIANRQNQEMQDDWDVIMNLIYHRNELIKEKDKNIDRIVRYDNQINELATEYSQNKIYIYSP